MAFLLRWFGWGGSSSSSSQALTVATPTAAGTTAVGGDGNGTALDNSLLDDSIVLLAGDVEWLDESEIQAQEDEDERFVRQLAKDSPLDEWLAQRALDTAQVFDVVEPATVSKTLGRKTVEYTVRSGSVTSVKRRYRDFVRLRAGLVNRFPGAVVPPLPESKMMGKFDPTFVERRRLHLENFVRAVARHPYLAADDLFVEFVASTAPFDRRSAVTARRKLVKHERLAEAPKRWAQALVATDGPKDPVQAVNAALQELEAFKAKLIAVRDMVLRLGNRVDAHAEALRDVAQALTTAQSAEYHFVALTSSTTQPLELPSLMADMLGRTQNAHSQMADVLGAETARVYESLVSPLKYEIMFVDTLLAAVRRTRASLTRHRSAFKAYKDAREAPSAATVLGLQVATTAAVPGPGPGLDDPMPHEGAGGEGGGDAEGGRTRMIAAQANADADKARRKLAKLRLAVVTAQRNARRDLVGTLVLELARYRAERVHRVRFALAAVAHVYLDHSSRAADVWRTLGDALAGVGTPTFADAPVARAPPRHHAVASSSANATAAAAPPPLNPFAAGAGATGGDAPTSPPTTMEAGQEPSESGGGGGGGASSHLAADGQDASGLQTRRLSQLRTLYPFRAEHADEMDVQPGEILEGVLASDDPNWFVATSKTTGRKGLVPANFVEVVGGVDGGAPAGGGGGGGGDGAEYHDDEEEEEDLDAPHADDDDGAGGGVPVAQYAGDSDESFRAAKAQAASDVPPVTNYIKQTQAGFKSASSGGSGGGTKRGQGEL